MIMSNFLLYLLCGVIFNAAWDLLADVIKKDGIRLTWGQRAVALILWPVYFILFLYHFIKTINND